MVQLICISERCNSSHLISNLNEILPHLGDGHKLMDVDEFQELFYSVQRDIRDFSNIKDVLRDSICATQQQLDKMQLVLKEKLIQIQGLSSNMEIIDMKTQSAHQAILLFQQFKDLKLDKKDVEIKVTQDLESFFDEQANLFDHIQQNLKQIDEFVEFLFKQKLKALQKDSIFDEHDPFTNYNYENQSLASRLSNRQFQSHDIQVQNTSQQMGSQRDHINEIEPSLGYIQEEPNRFQNYQNKDSGLIPLKGYKNQPNTSDPTNQVPVDIKRVLEQPQRIPPNIHSEPTQQQKKQPLQQEQQAKRTFKGIQVETAKAIRREKTQIPQQHTEKAPQITTIQVDVPQTLVKQVRFDKNFSQKQLVFRNDYAEAIVGDQQYLICDQSFKITGYSKLDILITPDYSDIEIKIGLVCLNKWNPISIEQYKKTQKTVSNSHRPILYLEVLTINATYKINIKLQNKQLEYTNIKKVKNLNLENFQDNDEITFFIEGKQCKIIIQ